MKKTLFILIVNVIVAMLLTMCGGTPQPAAQPTTAPAANAPAKTVLIGFTTSQTGKLNAEGKNQLQGLQLWLDDVKTAGGIKLADGTVVMPELKFYDDESDSKRVQSLYTKLITEDKADFLISPYSSGLTAAAAVVAEQYGKVMIATGAASDSTFEQGYKHTFQIYTPASRYLTGAIDLLKKVDPSAKRIAMVYEKEPFSTDVVNFAKTYAGQQGFEVVLAEGYDTATVDFGPFISKIVAANPDAIMGGGHFQDGTTFAKQLYEKKVSVKLISLLVAPAVPEFADLADAAEFITAPSQWEATAKYDEAGAKAAGIPWYGISTQDFVAAYTAKYGSRPGYHAAGGYAAGLVLQRAIEDAGSLDPAQVKAAFETMDVLTFFGHIKFDTGSAYGKQIGHEMVYLQWQKDATGKLDKPVVWPLEGKAADVLFKK
jgi:branched-chain amino acid transport system substrate-binding protein